MRILELCTTAWPQPDMQKQIDALREAFSANTSNPFELKPSFPYGSPIAPVMQPSPPLDHKYQMPVLSRHHSHSNISQQHPYPSAPITPPMTASLDGPHDGSMGTPNGNVLTNSQNASLNDAQAAWNPTPIFEWVYFYKDDNTALIFGYRGWNAAFGEHSASMAEVSATIAQQSPPLYAPTSLGMQSHSPLPGIVQANYTMPSSIPPLPRSNTSQIPTMSSSEPSFVTSNMWRESVANTYDRAPLKRGWDQQSSLLVDPMQSKRSRW